MAFILPILATEMRWRHGYRTVDKTGRPVADHLMDRWRTN